MKEITLYSRRFAGAFTALGVVVAGLTLGAQPAVADPASQDTLYVSQRPSCSNAGTGTQAIPYCTIGAAARVVEPGQTVSVGKGNFREKVEITRSGTPDKPIRFVGTLRNYDPETFVETPHGAAFTLTDVHDVSIVGMTAAIPREEGFLVTDSTRIRIDRSGVLTAGFGSNLGTDYAGVRLTGRSDDVTLSRMELWNSRGPGVIVDPGVTKAVITTSRIRHNGAGGIRVVNAPGTVLTSNTLGQGCGPAIALDEGSSGVSVQNNVVFGLEDQDCQGRHVPLALRMVPTATDGTTVDYNAFAPVPGGSLYEWAGTRYADPAGLTAATGQGVHDLLDTSGGDLGRPYEGSPVIDSANADAPGQLPTDRVEVPRANDPFVTDTGAGSGPPPDRGALEFGDPIRAGFSLSTTSGYAPVTVTGLSEATSPWYPITSTSLDFGDGSPPVTTTGNLRHTYGTPGVYSITMIATNSAGAVSKMTQQVSVRSKGDKFTATTPARLLDTRDGTGGPVAPIGQDESRTLQVAGRAGVPANATSVVLNVTVTEPTADSHLAVYPAGSPVPITSNLNFTRGQTIPNMVTVAVKDGKVDLWNQWGSVHVIVDLAGYYAPDGGSVYRPVNPFRLTDTRDGRFGNLGPLGPNETRVAQITGPDALSDAVVLNVTVTEPTADSHLIVFPDGQARPDSSNLNYAPGRTTSNMVVVPLVNGKFSLWNRLGSVHVIVDVVGYYSQGSGGSFNPAAARIMDTRDTGTPLLGNTPPRPLFIGGRVAGVPRNASAVVLNVTATNPTVDSHVTVYGSSFRPETSNLNYAAGETVPNLVIVPLDHEGKINLWTHNGAVDVIVDIQGYFIS